VALRCARLVPHCETVFGRQPRTKRDKRLVIMDLTDSVQVGNTLAEEIRGSPNFDGGPMRLATVRMMAIGALVGMYALNPTLGVVMLVCGCAYTIYQHQHTTRSHAGS
jgi:hypothetical protein